MAYIQKQQKVEAPPSEVISVINDIEHYPEFLPWCSGARILEQNGDELTARLDVAYKGFNESFTTINTSKEDGVRMQLVDGPFKYLRGMWTLNEAVRNGTLVRLEIEYEFKNKAASFLLNPAFKKMGDIMVERFCEQVMDKNEA